MPVRTDLDLRSCCEANAVCMTGTTKSSLKLPIIRSKSLKMLLRLGTAGISCSRRRTVLTSASVRPWSRQLYTRSPQPTSFLLTRRRTSSALPLLQTLRTSSSSSAPPDVATELVHPSPSTALDKLLPTWAAPAKPYLLLTRIDKPIGSILLYWPCGTSSLAPPPALSGP